MTRRSMRTRPLHEKHAGPIRVGLLLRMSTAHQEDSPAKQRENATRSLPSMVGQLGKTCGHQIVAEWEDAAVSGAEVVKRHGFHAMIAAAERGEIDVVVTRDSERFGRDTITSTTAMMHLHRRGVLIYFYHAGQFTDLSTPQGTLFATVLNAFAQFDRENGVGRTRESLERKARAGLNAGGRCYGYTNVRRAGADGVDYVVNPDAAAVVVWIFERFVDGWGLRRIARNLNARAIPAPRAVRWSGSTIGVILGNERYLGLNVWGRLSKVYIDGTKTLVENPDTEWTRKERPDLRVVPQELWDAVQKRRAANERSGLRPGGARAAAKYLLVGVSRCAECGSPMRGHSRKAGPLYVCAARREHGADACSNTVVRPTRVVDAAIVDWVRREVLSEDVISAILIELRARLRERMAERPAETARLEERRALLAGQRDRLADAIQFGDVPSRALVERLSSVERDLAETDRSLTVATAAAATIEEELDRLEAGALTRLRELHGALGDHTDAARTALRALFPSGIVLRPVGTGRGQRRLQAEGDAEALGAVVIREAAAARCLTVVDPKGT